MRDLLIIAIVMVGAIAAFRRPWIGIMLWTWLSVMNPHRYAYGMAYSAPLAAIAAASVLAGLMMTKQIESPFKGPPVTIFVVFMAWLTISWLFGFGVEDDYEQWKKIMKIDGMLLVALMLLHTKQHIFALMWTAAGSIAVLGIKGGIFTVASGGAYHVWGPPGSFIGGNNEVALAFVITIPLLRFLQLQMQRRLWNVGIGVSMLLCAAAALGSQSRGALLGMAAMAFTLWWWGKNKLQLGILLIAVAVPLVAFMPDTWSTRMATINTYQEDGSAMGRINAWWNAWNLAWYYPTGAGFNAARPELFARFAPDPDLVLAAHSIYFQILGNHGFVGLGLFLAIWFSTFFMAGSLRTQRNVTADLKWTVDMGAMCQVSLVGYAVGGAFLSLAYFDLPYIVMALVVLTQVWVKKQAWKTEPVYKASWKTIPGLAMTPTMSATKAS